MKKAWITSNMVSGKTQQFLFGTINISIPLEEAKTLISINHIILNDKIVTHLAVDREELLAIKEALKDFE